MSVQDKTRITVRDFERILARPENQDRLLELIDGEIVEKMPTEKHGEIVLIIGAEILQYLRRNRIGRVSTEARHTNPADDEHDLLPDVSFIAGDRPSVEEGKIEQMPDLAVEVKSRDDKPTKMQKKATYYLNNGTRLVWLIYPDTQTVEQLTQDAEGNIQRETLTVEDTLNGGDVLPGFTMAVKTIFEF